MIAELSNEDGDGGLKALISNVVETEAQSNDKVWIKSCLFLSDTLVKTNNDH